MLLKRQEVVGLLHRASQSSRSTYIIWRGLAGIAGMVFASTLNQFHLHRMGTSSTCMQTDGSAGPLFVVGGEGSIIGIPIGAALLQVLQNLATCWAFLPR